MSVDFSRKSSIQSAGFDGFKSVSELRETRLRDVPKLPGAYLVLAEPTPQPEFLERSVGGHFKGQDPTVSIAELQANWVDGAVVLNIGKAGGSGFKTTLRSRLSQYLRFGAGKPVGHWGGRYIWQLRGSDDLLICWKPTFDEEPREVEQALIRTFYKRFGKRPFANLQD